MNGMKGGGFDYISAERQNGGPGQSKPTSMARSRQKLPNGRIMGRKNEGNSHSPSTRDGPSVAYSSNNHQRLGTIHRYPSFGSPPIQQTQSNAGIYAQSSRGQIQYVVVHDQPPSHKPDEDEELDPSSHPHGGHDSARRIRDAARKRQKREVESNDEADSRRAKNLAAKRRYYYMVHSNNL